MLMQKTDFNFSFIDWSNGDVTAIKKDIVSKNIL